jgi:sulfur carrier protein ThiS
MTQNTFAVKVGQMPGRIEEFALETGTTFVQALEIAGLSAEGFEVKADGSTVSDVNNAIAEGTNVILLTKKVKGNNSVKIGVMPGRIEEYALEVSTTVAEALEVAGLDADGFEIKADGTTVSDVNQAIGSANVILLTKKVKGNN